MSTFIFTECSAKCCGSECHSAEQKSDGLLYGGISCGIVAAVIIFIMVIIFILRKIRREGKDETYIDPTHDFDTTNHHQPAGLNYIASPNYVGWNKINFKYTEEMTNEHSNSLIFWQLTWIIVALWFLFSFECLTWPVLVPTSSFLGIISVEYGQVTLNYRRCYLMTIICILETQYQSFSLYMYL